MAVVAVAFLYKPTTMLQPEKPATTDAQVKRLEAAVLAAQMTASGYEEAELAAEEALGLR